MIDLKVLCEGATEEQLVKTLIGPHLYTRGGIYCTPIQVTTKADYRTSKQYKGGVKNYQPVIRDIRKLLRSTQADLRLTTCLDLYALPKDFPGNTEHDPQEAVYDRVARLEEALATDVNDSRFYPYFSVHELEALVLVKPQLLLERFPQYKRSIRQLLKELGDSPNPELINGAPSTCPARRIQRACPNYTKTADGISLLQAIGLSTLRTRCPHFDNWLTHLENLVPV